MYPASGSTLGNPWHNRHMRSSRAPRVARGLVAASIATLTALLSHVTGGGAMPEWLGIAVPWMLSAAVCVVLAGRKLSAVRLSIAVVVSQLLFHTLFVLGAGAGDGAGAAASHLHHHGALTLTPSTTEALAADPTMWMWHGIAALLTVVALHRGEQAARRLLDLAHASVAWLRVRLAVTLPLPHHPRPTSPLGGVVAWVIRPAPQRDAHPRRGPPLLLAL